MIGFSVLRFFGPAGWCRGARVLFRGDGLLNSSAGGACLAVLIDLDFVDALDRPVLWNERGTGDLISILEFDCHGLVIGRSV